MIIYGNYRVNAGAFRPFVTGYVQSFLGRWLKFSFLVDSGADETFLHSRSIDILEIDISSVEVKRDVGGVGGAAVPYFQWETQLKLYSPDGMERLFGGGINIFLDPHATRVPLLARDVLDSFVTILDKSKNRVILLDKPDTYQLIKEKRTFGTS